VTHFEWVNQEVALLSEHQENQSSAKGYRNLIHLLNRRYREEWERAERFRAELDNLRRSPVWPLFAFLRGIKRWLRPTRTPDQTTFDSGTEALEPAPTSPAPRRVSIIIPFKDHLELLRGCLGSLRGSKYRRFEVVLVDNGSVERSTRNCLRRLVGRRGIRVIDCPGSFNFSRLCNEGAKHARGDFLLFLNNDVEALSRDWLEQMLLVAARPDVGVVGATLLYPDRAIQHAGIFQRSDGVWVHAYRGMPADSEGDHGELRQVRSVPAVTGACLLIDHVRFWELSGFDENLPLTCNDVDLCRRARERGWLVMMTPHARLIHFESLSRGYGIDRSGMELLASLRRPKDESP
jgi:GT2 family glycosyltransferase